MNTLNYSENNGVGEVVLNRPDLHNAFNAEFIQEATTLFKALSAKDLRAVTITGAGASFCAGADLNWMRSMKNYSEDENFRDSKALSQMFAALNDVPVPVIGLINGHALGGGAGLVACCDYALASEKALFGFTEARLGLIPAVISPYVMAKISETHARAWFMSGERFGAGIAMSMGLVHEVVKSESLTQRGTEIVKSFLSAGPKAAREAKALVKLQRVRPQVEDELCKRIARLRISDEGQEGMRALLEKDKPSWVKA